jgi:hypothetical protein
LPAGQVLIGYPFPTMNTHLMLFQAQDKMRFRLVGGSLIQPAANGENLYSAAPPSTCQSILNGYYLDGPRVPLTAGVLARCAGEMLSWHVSTVLWAKLGARPDDAETFFTSLLGPPTIGAPDSALWLDPQPALRLVVADGGMRAAARTTNRCPARTGPSASGCGGRPAPRRHPAVRPVSRAAIAPPGRTVAGTSRNTGSEGGASRC